MSKILAWFKALFTAPNMKGIAVTAERAAITAADVARGNILGAVTEATATTDAARSIRVVPK